MPSAERDALELADWAASGAVALTGYPNAAPLVPPGRAATFVRSRLAGLGLTLEGLLGERAAYAGLQRRAPWSCGGSFRILPTADGWLGLSLARDSDRAFVPALVEREDVTDLWAAVTAWAAKIPGAVAEQRLRLLGMPGGVVPRHPPADRPGVIARALGRRRRSAAGGPLVVDLTSMWAGPLCAHLLGALGAHVVKVESADRPDGARRGTPEYFDLLHRGHEMTTLDFKTQLPQLRELISRADLVLEASRPRALRQLGIIAEDVVASGTSWLSITARGRVSKSVGFGDDVAASAGLVVRGGGTEPLPAGDAVADPVAGVAAAVAAVDALAAGQARLIDVSMLHVVSETLEGTDPMTPAVSAVEGGGGAWWGPAPTRAGVVAPPRQE